MSETVHMPEDVFIAGLRALYHAPPEGVPSTALLHQLGDHPVGTIAECSCSKRYVMHDGQFDGKHWSQIIWPIPKPPNGA